MSDPNLEAPVKRGRGRPRKNPLPQGVTIKVEAPQTSVPQVAPAPEPEYQKVAREFAGFLASNGAKSSYLLELNDESTRKRVTTMVVRALFEYLTAIGAQYYAVNVQCNEENNPPTLVEQHKIRLDLIYAITQTDQVRITYIIPSTTGEVTYTIT